MKINLGQLSIRPVRKVEEPRYRELMQQYHYLGDLAKIGHTLWYVTLPVQRDARAQLSRFTLNPVYRTGTPKIMLTVQQMRTLPDFFNDIPDPR